MTLLFVAHGSPAPAYRAEAEAFLAAWRLQNPELETQLSYIEMEPFFPAVLQDLPEPLLVMPLFLHEGKHYREDVLAVAEASNKQVHMLPALTDLQTMAQMLEAACGSEDVLDSHIVLFTHGAGGAKAQAAIQALATTFEARTQRPCSIALAMGEPSLQQTLTQVAQAGAKHMKIVPHFIFGGAWQTKAQLSMDAVMGQFGCQIQLGLPLHANPSLLKAISHLLSIRSP